MSTASAVEDTARLVPHGVANAAALDANELVSSRLAAALVGPVADGADDGQPLLRTCDPTLPAFPLVMALMLLEPSSVPVCEVCARRGPATNRLTVVAGASAVLLHACDKCRKRLDRNHDLIWD